MTSLMQSIYSKSKHRKFIENSIMQETYPTVREDTRPASPEPHRNVEFIRGKRRSTMNEAIAAAMPILNISVNYIIILSKTTLNF
jgi:hypothetical protein